MWGRARRLAGDSGDTAALGALLLLVVAGTVVLAMLGKVQHVPVVFRDELIYGGLAESIASGQGVPFRAGEGVRSLFSYLLSPAWLLTSSVPDGYDLAKVFTAAMYSLTVIPLWLALRRPIGAWIALIPCVLILAAPWSGDSSKMLTEALALPVVTAAIAMLWWALRSSDRGHTKLLIGLALVGIAALIRVHLAALIPVFALAILLDAIVKPREERSAAVRRFAPELIAAAVIAVVGTLMVFVPGLKVGLGIYGGVDDFGIDGQTLQRTYEYFAMMGIYGALLPPIAFIALAITRKAWGDPDLGSLLAIVIAMAVVMLPFVGWFSAGVGTTVVERYAVYLIPWLLVMPFFGIRILPASHVVIATIIVAVIVVLPITITISGVADTYVQGRRVFGEFFGLLGNPAGASIVVLTLLLGLAYAVSVDRVVSDDDDQVDDERFGSALLEQVNQRFEAVRRLAGGVSNSDMAFVVGAVLLLITAPMSNARWDHLSKISDRALAQVPAKLDWVDKEVGRDRSVSIVALGEDLPGIEHNQTDFFNSSVNATYLQNRYGGDVDIAPCLVDLNKDGRLTGRSCPDPATAILATGDLYRFSLQGGKIVAANQGVGTLMTTNVRPVRLQSLVGVPCSPSTGECKGRMIVRLWTMKPSKLKVVFRGEGEAGNTVLVNDRFYDIPASGSKRIELDIPAGTQAVKFQLSWLAAEYNPSLESITLNDDEIFAIDR